MSVAAQSSRSLSIFFCESSASVNRNSVSSNPAHDIKGNQLSSAFVVSIPPGGSFGERNMSCSSQGQPLKNKKRVILRGFVRTIQVRVIDPL